VTRFGLIALALVLSGCYPEEPPSNPYSHGGPVACGQIDAVDLISLREQEAAEYARRGGCEMLVVTRDGRPLVPPELGPPPDPDLPQTKVSVTVRDGYVHRLGR